MIETFCLFSALPASHNQQSNAAHERNSSHKRWQGKRFSLLGSHLDRTDVDDLLPGRVGDALIRERDDSNYDKDDAYQRVCFYFAPPLYCQPAWVDNLPQDTKLTAIRRACFRTVAALRTSLKPATVPRLQTFCHPTFYPVFLRPLFQVFLEAEIVSVVSEPSAVAAAVVSEPSAVAAAVVSEPSAVAAAVVSEPSAVAAAVASEPSAVAAAVVSEPSAVAAAVVSEPSAVAAAVASEPSAVAAAVASEPSAVVAVEPGVVFVSEPQVSVDIAVAFVVLVPVSVFAVEADSSGRPRFPVFPNVYHFSNSSSFVEVVGEESVHSSIGARTNYVLCSILSNPDLHHNKNWEHSYNNPSPGHNNVNDTSGLPTGRHHQPFQKKRSTSMSGST